jgi:hypothetical protein
MGLVWGGAVLIGGMAGRIGLLLSIALPRAASALVGTSSKVAATKSAGFRGLSIFLPDQWRVEVSVPCLATRRTYVDDH